MSGFTTNNFTIASAAPGSPKQGDMWYNVATSSLLQYSGTAWLGSMPEYVQAFGLGASSSSITIWTAPNTSDTWQVQAASVIFGVTSSSGTMQVEAAAGTTAVGSGTNQLSSTMSLSGTANTIVNGTVIASPTTLSAGSRVNIILAGTLTGLANCCVTVAIQKLT